MRRIVSILLVILMFMSTTMLSFGEKEQRSMVEVVDGISKKTQEVAGVNLLMGGEDVYTDVPSILYTIKGKSRTLVPIRFVVEKLGAEISWNQEKQEATIVSDDKMIVLKIDSATAYVNGKKVKLPNNVPAKLLGYNGNYRTMVPLRFVVEQLGMEVNWIGETMTATVDLPKQSIKDISYYEIGATSYVSIKTTGEVDSKYLYLEGSKYGGQDRLVVDIPNASLDIPNSNVAITGLWKKDINFNGIASIRASLFEKEPREVTRVVIDLSHPRSHRVYYDKKEGGIKIEFSNRVKNVEITKKLGIDAVVINTQEYPIINTINLGNRMVVDILNAELATNKNTIDVNKAGLKSIRMAQFEPDINYDKDDKIVRVVLDLEEGQSAEDIFVSTEENDVVIYINNKPLDTINYYKESQERGSLTIKLEENVKSHIEYDRIKNKLKVSVPKEYAKLQDIDLEMYDDIVKNISIRNDRKFYYVNVYLYDKITYKDYMDNSTSSLMLEFTNQAIAGSKYKGKLIILDAGHGGKDPGAHGSVIRVNEKDVALDTVFRLEKLLQEAGFKTHLTRKNDTYVGLYERPKIANGLNADAFVSVHYNWHPNSEVRGVQVLYNGDDPFRDNKNFARIMQNKLVSVLNAPDKGIVHRPKLVVIRETKMPAVLTEMGFLSNNKEEANIATDDYRQRAAQAMFEGIKAYFDSKL
ncbi:MAG: N-acetylmuramoyl-L-alanine amidase family protein [Anaeromicrobium sp.]|uniref:N-acetylmuramoyl-L-alanine amidase family protein n=1 Tax=Anaeromicrobium sp. TaxID=1929132 RepID=UPI0025D2447D|nr:N-acetylmuramoyl-L-alanine amidase family protein [Anaeromicrobium sp.]MCT4593226.1 N-acetylmuramoyl-L-alanine amidase family protein [Anaeromicrobium sp.]